MVLKYDKYPLIDNFIMSYLHQGAILPVGERYSVVLKEFEDENGKDFLINLAEQVNLFRIEQNPDNYDSYLKSRYPNALIITSADTLFESILTYANIPPKTVNKENFVKFAKPNIFHTVSFRELGRNFVRKIIASQSSDAYKIPSKYKLVFKTGDMHLKIIKKDSIHARLQYDEPQDKADYHRGTEKISPKKQ